MTNSILTKSKVLGGKFAFFYLEDDKYVGQRAALGKYEPYETELMLRNIKKGDVVVDIGANIGFDTILFADKVGEKGRVYAFEPDPTNFSILKKNIEENNLKNVTAVQVALSNKSGRVDFFKSGENYGDHRLFSDNKNREKIRVSCKTLDRFLGTNRVDFIKIDTQGHEPAVISGAKNIIKKHKPIIFFEYWPEAYKQAKMNSKQMMVWLNKIYGKTFLIDDWFYVYRALNKNKIDKICSKNKTGYADLFVKKDLTVKDKINQFKDIRIKKVIKKIFNINK